MSTARLTVTQKSNEPPAKRPAVAGSSDAAAKVPARTPPPWSYEFERRIPVDSEVMTLKFSPDDEFFACGCKFDAYRQNGVLANLSCKVATAG
jgi:hypothetical protein